MSQSDKVYWECPKCNFKVGFNGEESSTCSVCGTGMLVQMRSGELIPKEVDIHEERETKPDRVEPILQVKKEEVYSEDPPIEIDVDLGKQVKHLRSLMDALGKDQEQCTAVVNFFTDEMANMRETVRQIAKHLGIPLFKGGVIKPDVLHVRPEDLETAKKILADPEDTYDVPEHWEIHKYMDKRWNSSSMGEGGYLSVKKGDGSGDIFVALKDRDDYRIIQQLVHYVAWLHNRELERKNGNTV